MTDAETPRTDKLCRITDNAQDHFGAYIQMRRHANQLERELSAAQSRFAELEAKLKVADDVVERVARAICRAEYISNGLDLKGNEVHANTIDAEIDNDWRCFIGTSKAAISALTGQKEEENE